MIADDTSSWSLFIHSQWSYLTYAFEEFFRLHAAFRMCICIMHDISRIFFDFSQIFFEHDLVKKCCAYVQIKKYFSKIAFLSKNCNFSRNMNSIKQSSPIKVLFSKFRYLVFSLLKIDFFDVIRHNTFQTSFDEVHTFSYERDDKIL